MKIKDYAEYYYKTYRMIRHAESTYLLMMNYIRVHIVPSELGEMRIKDAKTSDYQAFVNELSVSGNRNTLHNMKDYGKPLSAATVSKIRRLLINMCATAVREGMVEENYAEKTECVPVRKKRYHEVFAPEQQEEFLNHTKNYRYYAAYVLAFYTGMRRGEILGLSWNSIDFVKETISITQTLLAYEQKVVLQKWHAKTELSLRTIPTPKAILDVLAAHRVKQEAELARKNLTNEENMVFLSPSGGFVNPQFFSRSFKNICIKLGFSKFLHLHCTRHTWATNMMQANVPIPDIQALGGWSSPDMLLNVYAHTRVESHRVEMEKLVAAQSLPKDKNGQGESEAAPVDLPVVNIPLFPTAYPSYGYPQGFSPSNFGVSNFGMQTGFGAYYGGIMPIAPLPALPTPAEQPKKRRGRPPKSQQKDDYQPVAKRGPGRPRKSEAGKKRRGRPPKDGIRYVVKRGPGRSPKAKPAEVGQPEKRRRGRPRKTQE